MTTKHTPEPWAVRDCLIAAAPIMLAELKRLAEHFGWPPEHPACQIIAKAEGRGLGPDTE